MSSTDLYSGIDLIVAGKVGMGLSVASRLPEGQQDDQRPDRHDGHAGLWQGQARRPADLRFARPRHFRGSANPEAAAKFLEYLQSPEMLKAMYDKTGWIPANTNFDISVIQDPVVRDMWQKWGLSPNIPYLANLVPGQFYEQALLPTAQQVVGGKITGAQAGDLAADVAKQWRDFNPDVVENYKKWAADLAAEHDAKSESGPRPQSCHTGFRRLKASEPFAF